MDRMLKDASGKELPEQEVIDRAYDNILASMSQRELASEYLAGLDEYRLLEWATDEEGNFCR